ncbi:DEKNAAC104664 [Brettanomyces naardenensis]|uniref:DEKNAAC104664 n=1 Tax=Brettanomyces naardenensis TaxID=13370 RepID=A0A448YQY2_BRENA|nr:DEKNAAC104664 [Brettanomyces naardenensis]
MGIPAPQFDTVLLREHLYRDLKKDFLVLPPESRQSFFRPISDIGLGLYRYKFAQDDEISTTSPAIESILWREFLLHLVILSTIALFFCVLYRAVFKHSLPSPRRSLWKVPDLENSYHPVMAMHTPIPSLSFSPSSENQSPEASPENIFIKTTTIPDDVPRFKPSIENDIVSRQISTVEIR